MSPMGFPVRRQARLQQYDEESAVGDEMTDRSSDMPTQIRPVPIWLCVFLVIGYIIAGAFLFDQWEHWGFLNSAYFCFITLTTIGSYILTLRLSIVKSMKSNSFVWCFSRLRGLCSSSRCITKPNCADCLLFVVSFIWHRSARHELQSGAGRSYCQCKRYCKTNRHFKGGRV